MKTDTPYLEVLEKETEEVSNIPVRDFLNPKGTKTKWDKATGLKPITFNQSYTILVDMLGGEIYQNEKFAVRYKGVKHKWEWL